MPILEELDVFDGTAWSNDRSFSPHTLATCGHPLAKRSAGEASFAATVQALGIDDESTLAFLSELSKGLRRGYSDAARPAHRSGRYPDVTEDGEALPDPFL